MLKLFNSLTNKKQEFVPINPGLVKMYSCGPTVYSYQHIGNMRAYIFMDSLRRTLKFNGYKILGVMNVTDVGHLTSDEDNGDDKMELAAKKEQKSPYEIAKFYADKFFADLKLLNVDIPEHITYATQYIPQMIEFVKGLEAKGYTYRTSDGIYFDVQKFSGYGQLSAKDLSNTGNARIEENLEKHHPFDFALWKFVPENHIMKWDSPWGVGCPGWHIECSSMGRDILGDRFDIHTGGIDHKTVHHEDEIAQNDALAGHRVVNFWMHNEFLAVDGGKMSKSLGNVWTLKDLADRGFEPLDFKYFCLNTHYSKKLNFTFDALHASSLGYNNLRALVASHKNGENKIESEKLEKYSNEFLNAINDDLNFPLAIGVLWTMLRSETKSSQIFDLVQKFDKALGLGLDGTEKMKEVIPQEIEELAKTRWQARLTKNWVESDRLRDELLKLGYVVRDGKDGYSLEKK
jgi:cysteinyl-tRNA synthetase